MQTPGTWVQSSLSYAEENVTVPVGHGLVNNSALPFAYPGESGIDDSTNPHAYPMQLSGSDPSTEPSWASYFATLNEPTTYDQQAWAIPAQTLGAYKEISCDSYWINAYGFQLFDWKVNGALTGTTARRDLNWYSKDGYAIIIADVPGGGGVGVPGGGF